MICKKILNHIFNSCTYVLHQEEAKNAIIIDCGDVQPIVDYLSANNLTLYAILLTHSHFDHIYGIPQLTHLYPSASIYTSINGIEGLRNPKYNLSHYQNDVPDFVFESEHLFELKDNEEINLAGIHIKALSTEGHDWSCLSYIVNNMIFTGDSYIPSIHVVANWPKSNKQEAYSNYNRLKEMESNGYTIMAGHKIKNVKRK